MRHKQITWNNLTFLGYELSSDNYLIPITAVSLILDKSVEDVLTIISETLGVKYFLFEVYNSNKQLEKSLPLNAFSVILQCLGIEEINPLNINSIEVAYQEAFREIHYAPKKTKQAKKKKINSQLLQ